MGMMTGDETRAHAVSELRRLADALGGFYAAVPGEGEFTTATEGGGHGDADYDHGWEWCDWSAPEGFAFVTDAECTTILMARTEHAEQVRTILDTLDTAANLSGWLRDVADGLEVERVRMGVVR